MERPFQDAIDKLEDIAKRRPAVLFVDSRAAKGLERTKAIISKVADAVLEGNDVFKEYFNEYRGAWAFVHPSTVHPGGWRYSEFDERGWKGHEDGYETQADALFSMFQSGYIIPSFGILSALMTQDAWKKGSKIQALKDEWQRLYSSGKHKEAEAIVEKINAIRSGG